ncbi:MAG: hypothetical protein RSE41_10225 [Clostridia bacterium]
MSQTNISKYIQINEYMLLEYKFNKSNEDILDVKTQNAALIQTNLNYSQYIEYNNNYKTNNNFLYNSLPTNIQKSEWFYHSNKSNVSDSTYYEKFIDRKNTIPLTGSIPLDTIRIHVLSGYQFNNIDGVLLQLNVERNDGSDLSLANFTWNKYLSNQFNKSMYFAKNTLFLGAKSYDKYIEFKIPSVYFLGKKHSEENKNNILHALNVKYLSDIKIKFGTIPTNSIKVGSDNTYYLNDIISTQFPTVSIADNFNCVISQSNNGDYLEYFATWDNRIISYIMDDIETGKITLYTSSNPNDNYSEFEEYWGDERKWVLIHDIEVKEFLIGGSSVITQRLSFTQSESFDIPNLYRPIILNNDASSYNITYTCRLINRMDGSQIIRKSSFSSNDTKKFGKKLAKIDTNNIINYTVFNKIHKSENIIKESNDNSLIKYIKIYYNSNDIVLNVDNNDYEQGAGPLYLKNGGGYYKFNFFKLNNDEKIPVDLSGMYGYRFISKLSNNTKIIADSTNSTNMNTMLGQLEFYLSETDIDNMLNSTTNEFIIQLKNSDDSYYTFYQGNFYSIKNKNNL